MNSPWVSRTAYDLLAKQLEDSEKERKMLLDKVLVMSGLSPVAPIELPTEPAEVEKILDKTGAINIPKIIAMAEAKKREEYKLRTH